MTANGAFHERAYLITGAASGIGLSTARMLQQQGARLMLWDRDAPALERAAAALGASAQMHTVDITQPEPVTAAMDHCIAQLGGLHGVIHSAGVLRTGLFEQVDLAVHRRHIEINLFGTLLVARCALPHLRRSRGSLIFMASVAAFYGPAEYASYGASKAGVLNFAQGLRIELHGSGVHVGVVCPHSVDTPMLDAQNRTSRFVQRFGTPHTADQVAAAILRGIRRRQFMIFPGVRPWLIHWLTKVCSPALAHRIMWLLWR